MKNFFTSLLVLLLGVVMAGVVSAQTTNITFPIPELGNCQSMSACKTYCDDPTHLDACIAFAKSKGFYHETQLDNQKEDLLADAKTTLGCDSFSSCQTFCADVAHADACTSFAKKHNLSGGTTVVEQQILVKAKATLGCDSPASCQAFCERSENQEKCIAFAKDNGLGGGREIHGPGGCNSAQSCKTFCTNPNNFRVCQRFVDEQGEHEGSESGHKSFTGPGGCNSEDSCKAFCSTHPDACHIGPMPPVSLPPITPGQNPCSLHPELCQQPLVSINPSDHPTFPSGSPSNFPSIDPQHACEAQGCKFSNNTCVCPPPPSTGQASPFPTGLTSGDHGGTPSPTGSVHGISTHRTIFEWIVDEFFHLR